MKTFDPSTFSFGAELELGDVPRNVLIPERLGKWEYAETDIVNLRDPYKYVCCDPLGIDPPVGGEINTMPTYSPIAQAERCMEIVSMFRAMGVEPTVCATSHLHIHIHVPGLREDLGALKRLVSYIKANQETAIREVYGFKEHPQMKNVPGSKMYLKFDGGRPMPDYMCDNIVNLATSFDHFIKLHAAGKDGVSMGRPFRFAINTYSLKHINTVEFRFFRSTLDQNKMESCFLFVKEFMDAAINNGPSVQEILDRSDFDFPKMIWDIPTMLGWNQTRYDKERGKKDRHFYDAE